MQGGEVTLLGGLALGFASSLHCAGMCGGIAAGLTFAFGGSAAARLRTLFVLQAGRVLSYVLAGAILGAVGSRFYALFDQAALHGAMRWAAAVALGWIGFSMMGLAPAPVLLDRLTAPIAGKLAGRAAAFLPGPAPPVPAGGTAGALAAGVAWGLMPCGMVFGALFYAMLSGSAGGGAAVMAGFGLGTLPAVAGTALGIDRLRRLGASPRNRVLAGLALMLVAVAGILVPPGGWAASCLT